MKKDAVLAQIRAEKIIGLVGADLGADLIDCARALAAGGIHSLELTMTTPAAVPLLERAQAALPEFHFGLGTVLDADTARLGLLAGARFIVTPALRPDVITLCRRFNAPVISGAFSTEDIVAAHAAGADAVKIIPGGQFGPPALAALKQRLPDIALIPIGGVTPETIIPFLRAGAFAVMAGASLIDDTAVRARDWAAITARARVFTQASAAVTSG